jgi:hypothetical protein
MMGNCNSNNLNVDKNINKEVTKVVVDTIKTTFTQTGDIKKDELRAKYYAKAVGMDSANTKMAVIAATQGWDAASKAMMEECGNDYATMRSRYG